MEHRKQFSSFLGEQSILIPRGVAIYLDFGSGVPPRQRRLRLQLLDLGKTLDISDLAAFLFGRRSLHIPQAVQLSPQPHFVQKAGNSGKK